MTPRPPDPGAPGPRRGRGFTLIELMIVVAIIGVLAAIAIPKFGDLIIRSKESSAKGALGTFRGAIDIYYVATEGQFPTTTSALTIDSKFVAFLPMTQLPPALAFGNAGHAPSATVEDYTDVALFGTTNEGTNIWAYVSTGTDHGHVGFNCTHMDSRGTVWSDF